MSENNSDNSVNLTKATNICRFLSRLCRIAFVIIVVWGAFGIAVMIYSIVTSNPIADVMPIAISVPFVFALYSANASMLPLVFGNMLGDISKDSTPFTLKNSRRLFYIAVILLISALLEELLAIVSSQFSLAIVSNSIEVGDFIWDFVSSAGTALNLFPLIMSAMFFALSYVFKYGVLLQEQSDETL